LSSYTNTPDVGGRYIGIVTFDPSAPGVTNSLWSGPHRWTHGGLGTGFPSASTTWNSPVDLSSYTNTPDVGGWYSGTT
jgi:hypothetical protein